MNRPGWAGVKLVPLWIAMALAVLTVAWWLGRPHAPAQTAGPAAAASPATGLAQSDAQGAVDVAVTPLNLERPGDTLDFQVSLNTHSVDLSFNLAAQAMLRDDRGREVKALTWEGGTGGHHLSGRLTFPIEDASGTVLLGPQTHHLELLLRDVAGVPQRTFRWNLQP